MSSNRDAVETTVEDVLDFLRLTDELGIRVWLDGGWAVDALLGRQTRRHADLDIVIERRHVEPLLAQLRRRGFDDVPRDDTEPWNFVVGDAAGREVDFHVVEIDSEGNGLYGRPEGGVMYPAASLTGEGNIEGRPTRCISPQWLVRFHTGYPVDATDWADVSALCAAFGVPVPADYARFTES